MPRTAAVVPPFGRGKHQLPWTLRHLSKEISDNRHRSTYRMERPEADAIVAVRRLWQRRYGIFRTQLLCRNLQPDHRHVRLHIAVQCGHAAPEFLCHTVSSREIGECRREDTGQFFETLKATHSKERTHENHSSHR